MARRIPLELEFLDVEGEGSQLQNFLEQILGNTNIDLGNSQVDARAILIDGRLEVPCEEALAMQ